GDNTTSGTVETVENPSGTTFRYIFSNPAPENYVDFAAGDQVTFSDLINAANNGTYLLTGVVTLGDTLDPVVDFEFSNPDDLSDAPVLGDRHLILPDAAVEVHEDAVLDKDLANPSNLTPDSGDRYIVHGDANAETLDPIKG